LSCFCLVTTYSSLPIETQEKISFFFDQNAPPSGVDLDDLSRFASSETFKDILVKFSKFQSLAYLRKWGNNYNSYRNVPSPRQPQEQKTNQSHSHNQAQSHSHSHSQLQGQSHSRFQFQSPHQPQSRSTPPGIFFSQILFVLKKQIKY